MRQTKLGSDVYETLIDPLVLRSFVDASLLKFVEPSLQCVEIGIEIEPVFITEIKHSWAEERFAVEYGAY